jgi:hypothetical protein
MPILFQHFISRADLIANPTTLYIFGDNLERMGMGGQAREMRHQPNAIGLPTKRSPYEFLTNHDLDEILLANRKATEQIYNHLTERGIVIWPLDGIGTGLAELSTRAPLIRAYYDETLTFWRTL